MNASIALMAAASSLYAVAATQSVSFSHIAYLGNSSPAGGNGRTDPVMLSIPSPDGADSARAVARGGTGDMATSDGGRTWHAASAAVQAPRPDLDLQTPERGAATAEDAAAKKGPKVGRSSIGLIPGEEAETATVAAEAPGQSQRDQRGPTF